MSIRKQGDIYSGPGDKEKEFEPDQEAKEGPEQWRRDYLKNKFWSLFLGLVVFVFTAGIIWLLIQNYLSLHPDHAGNTADEIRRHSRVVGAHRLSVLTDWAIDYNEPIDTEIKDVTFNEYWLKRAAYHVINAEQAYQNQDRVTAREQFNKALEIFPDLKGIYLPLGNLALMDEHYDEAIKLYEKAAAEEDEMTYLLASNLGAACLGAKKYEKAEKYLLQAIDLRSNAPEAYKNMAALYKKTGNIEGASEYFEKYLNLVPDDLDVMQSYAMYMTANAKWTKAAVLLRKLNTEFPDVAPLFFLRAQVEIQLGNNNDAIKALKRGIQLVDSSYALAWLSKNDFDALRSSKEFQEMSSEVQVGAKQ